jgi:hypothetical protein
MSESRMGAGLVEAVSLFILLIRMEGSSPELSLRLAPRAALRVSAPAVRSVMRAEPLRSRANCMRCSGRSGASMLDFACSGEQSLRRAFSASRINAFGFGGVAVTHERSNGRHLRPTETTSLQSFENRYTTAQAIAGQPVCWQAGASASPQALTKSHKLSVPIPYRSVLVHPCMDLAVGGEWRIGISCRSPSRTVPIDSGNVTCRRGLDLQQPDRQYFLA